MSLHIRQQAMAEAEAEAEADSSSDASHSSLDEREQEAEDDWSEPVSRPLRFSNDCPALPADRGPGFPHIVITRDFDEGSDTSSLTVADGVATFLWNWDRVQLYKFFDMSREQFEIHYDAPRAPIRDMLITRQGSTVMAGFRIPDMYGGMEWDPQLVFSIEADGKWIGRMCSEATGREAIEMFGKSFAKALFYHEVWNLRGSAKVTVYHD